MSARIKAQAALSAYGARFGKVPIEQQFPELPVGTAQRINSVVEATAALLDEADKMAELLAYVARNYPQVGPVRDFIDPEWREPARRQRDLTDEVLDKIERANRDG